MVAKETSWSNSSKHKDTPTKKYHQNFESSSDLVWSVFTLIKFTDLDLVKQGPALIIFLSSKALGAIVYLVANILYLLSVE